MLQVVLSNSHNQQTASLNDEPMIQIMSSAAADEKIRASTAAENETMEFDAAKLLSSNSSRREMSDSSAVYHSSHSTEIGFPIGEVDSVRSFIHIR
jgi:hypothetical protein